MHHRIRAFLRAGIPGIVLLLTAVTAARGQVDLSQWPKVQLAVIATDNRGNPAPVPSASGVVVRENGEPQAVLALSAALQPESVCILVDSSKSIASRLDEVRTATSHFLEALPPEDEFCFASFSWHLEL